MKALLFRNVVLPERDPVQRFDVLVEGAAIVAVEPAGRLAASASARTLGGAGRWLLPGFIDDHVHLREPGLAHKEGFASGTRAAAAGGVTTLFEIQNNQPLMTDREALLAKRALVQPKSVVQVEFYASLVPAAMGKLASMSDLVAGYKLFLGPSTGGLDVSGEERLEAMFREVSRTGRWLFVHAEDGALIAEGLRRHGSRGAAAWHLARSAEAEIEATRHALRLGGSTDTRVHVFHLSTGGALEQVCRARAAGQTVAAGTCPHYLYFTHKDTARMGSVLRVNPSIKTAADREALLAGLASGTIDCLSSDHAPHTAREKSRPFAQAPSGIPSLDIYMPLCLTMVERGWLHLETVLDRAAHTPARLHDLTRKGRVETGFDADLVLLDPHEHRKVEVATHRSRARLTPYEGMLLVGWPQLTLVMGEVAYERD